jgi:hypothetical protein
MYQLGFGDCFLLSFYYGRALNDGRKERHMLIDFGSTRYPKSGFKISGVAEQIQNDCDELDVIAVSHRHKDHLSGFGIAKSAEIIDALNPKLIVRSWTEDPKAARDATGVTRVGDDSLQFAAALTTGQALTDALSDELLVPGRGIRAELAEIVEQQTLNAVGRDGLSNAKAYDQLDNWGKAGRQEFLFFGAKSMIPDFIPGIEVRVLGPPTVDQHSEVTGARVQDPDYWMFHQELLAMSIAATELQPDRISHVSDAEMRVPSGPVRWLVRKMQRQHINNLLNIVRELDDALNNTSLILLIDAGDKRMLFPGDAQIENWNYALKLSEEGNGLSAGEVHELLKGVDLYKVGHHGSRNATPRTLLETIWGEDDHDIVALMGTKKKVHGKVEATAVPRQTLVEALIERTRDRLWSTASLPNTEGATVEVRAKLKGGHPFEYTGPSDVPEPVADPTTELARH